MAKQSAKKQSEDRMKAGNRSRVIDIEEAQRIRRERRAAATKGKRKVVAAKEPVVEVAREKRGAGRRVIYLMVTVLVLVSVCVSGVKILDLKAEAAKAEHALALRTEEKARLERELAMLNDPEYIEAQAREQLRMIKDGETLYVLDAKTEEDAGQ